MSLNYIVGKSGEKWWKRADYDKRCGLRNAIWRSGESQRQLDQIARAPFLHEISQAEVTAECVAVNQGVDKVVLEEEIQDLISEGILGKKSDASITYYCLNRTLQELTELTEGFLRDRHLHATGVRAETG